MKLTVKPIEPTILPESEFEEDVEEAGAAAEETSIRLRLSSQDCGERLDKVLSRLLSQYSRSRIQQWIEAGFVLVDGQAARAKSTVLGDENVLIEPQSEPQEHAFAAEPIPLSVVHEDADLLVLNKPAGLVVHPAAGNWSGTLLNGLLHYLPALESVPRAGIVHRLDKDTSGLMVVAKTLEAHTDLIRELQARTVKREYLALVWGMPQVTGKIDAAISRHPRDRIKMAVSQSDFAKPAVTHFQRLGAGKLDGRQVSLVQCRLETGRTHQIRVHMQSIGFPLVGDPLYGKPHLASAFERQALHARRLALVHPRTGETIEWSAAVPDDMNALLESAGLAAAAEG